MHLTKNQTILLICRPDSLQVKTASKKPSLEDWDNWNLICRTSNIGGSVGKLVTLESRTELDCLIEYINDEFDDPSTMSKYTVGLKGKTTQNVGIYKWQGVDTSTD